MLRSLPCLSGKQMKLHNSEPSQPSPAKSNMAKPVLSNAGGEISVANPHVGWDGEPPELRNSIKP